MFLARLNSIHDLQSRIDSMLEQLGVCGKSSHLTENLVLSA